MLEIETRCDEKAREATKSSVKEYGGLLLAMATARYGCRRIAMQISNAFGVELSKDVVRRVLNKYFTGSPSSNGLDEYRWKKHCNGLYQLSLPLSGLLGSGHALSFFFQPE